MSITHDQALAFFSALLESKPMRFHLEAVLGYGKSPGKASDFESNNAETLDRCEELLGHVEECTELLKLQLRDRPRQQNFEFPENEDAVADSPQRKAGSRMSKRGRKKG